MEGDHINCDDNSCPGGLHDHQIPEKEGTGKSDTVPTYSSFQALSVQVPYWNCQACLCPLYCIRKGLILNWNSKVSFTLLHLTLCNGAVKKAPKSIGWRAFWWGKLKDLELGWVKISLNTKDLFFEPHKPKKNLRRNLDKTSSWKLILKPFVIRQKSLLSTVA